MLKSIVVSLLLCVYGVLMFAHESFVHEKVVQKGYDYAATLINPKLRNFFDNNVISVTKNFGYVLEAASAEDSFDRIRFPWTDQKQTGSSLFADAKIQTIDHFWDADRDPNGVNYSNVQDFDFTSYAKEGLRSAECNVVGNAFMKAEILYEDALNNWFIGEIFNTLDNLGRVSHLLCDMGVPTHTRLDSHAPDIWEGVIKISEDATDTYEDWMPTNCYRWSNVDNQTLSTIIPSVNTNGWRYGQNLLTIDGVPRSRLHYIFFLTNQIADFFNSDTLGGDEFVPQLYLNIKGRTTGNITVFDDPYERSIIEERLSDDLISNAYGLPDIYHGIFRDFYKRDRSSCFEMGNIAYLYSIRMTGELFQIFDHEIIEKQNNYPLHINPNVLKSLSYQDQAFIYLKIVVSRKNDEVVNISAIFPDLQNQPDSRYISVTKEELTPNHDLFTYQVSKLALGTDLVKIKLNADSSQGRTATTDFTYFVQPSLSVSILENTSTTTTATVKLRIKTDSNDPITSISSSIGYSTMSFVDTTLTSREYTLTWDKSRLPNLTNPVTITVTSHTGKTTSVSTSIQVEPDTTVLKIGSITKNLSQNYLTAEFLVTKKSDEYISSIVTSKPYKNAVKTTMSPFIDKYVITWNRDALPVGNLTMNISLTSNLSRTATAQFTIFINSNGFTPDNASIPVQKYKTEIQNNYPNPFNPATTISYSVSEPGQTKLSVFNTKGKLILVLVDEYKGSGSYSAFWDGKDTKGNEVPSGLYYSVLESNGKKVTKKMIMLK